MRTVYGDHARFIQTYFETYKGKYFTGDGCRRDEDGYYWITGRVDDVINVSGHRMGTAEVESALVLHPTRSPRPRWSAIRTTSRGRASTAMSR
jgi:acetyl-CoA synthetase